MLYATLNAEAAPAWSPSTYSATPASRSATIVWAICIHDSGVGRLVRDCGNHERQRGGGRQYQAEQCGTDSGHGSGHVGPLQVVADRCASTYGVLSEMKRLDFWFAAR